MSWGFERQHYLPLGVIISTTLDTHEEISASAGKWSADTSTIKMRFAAMLLVLFYEEWQHQGRVTVTVEARETLAINCTKGYHWVCYRLRHGSSLVQGLFVRAGVQPRASDRHRPGRQDGLAVGNSTEVAKNDHRWVVFGIGTCIDVVPKYVAIGFQSLDLGVVRRGLSSVTDPWLAQVRKVSEQPGQPWQRKPACRVP